MKQTTLITLFMLCLAVSLKAQGVEQFKTKLRQTDSAYLSQVLVSEHGAAASAIRSFAAKSANEKVRGYRVCVFVNNSQSAGAAARSTFTRFRELFPDVPAYVTYRAPDFKVSVGNCLTSEEAIILWGKVKGSFENAFISREDIPLSVLAEKPAEIAPEISIQEETM